MTEFNITKIIVDESRRSAIAGDVILITVTDAEADWWKVVIKMQYSGPPNYEQQIFEFTAKSSSGYSDYINPVGGEAIGPNNPMVFNDTTCIDLLSESNYEIIDGLGGCYQYAEVGDTNTLLTQVGDDSTLTGSAIIYYLLKIR